MYQQFQNNSNFSNQNPRDFQNVSSENQQSSRQLQIEMSRKNNYEFPRQAYMGPPQLPQNQTLLGGVNSLPMATNNVFNTGVGIEYPSTSSAIRPAQSPYHNRGNDSNRIQRVFQHTPTSFPSPSVLIPQNNKNFSAQYGIDSNQGRVMTSRENTVDRFETRAATSNPDTVPTVNMDKIRKNENERIRIFTGTPEKVIQWHKIYNDYFCFYELIASVISIQEGTVRLQKILLLRDKKGPIIQVTHYTNNYINVPNFYVGQMLRCVGHMVGYNILHGLSIREATPDEVTTIRRMCYIGDHAIAKALKKS